MMIYLGYSSGDNFTKIWYHDSNDNYIRFGALEPDQSYSHEVLSRIQPILIVLFLEIHHTVRIQATVVV